MWLRSPCVSNAHWECPPSPPWAPWLLIEMCAWSLVTDASAGCPRVVSSTDRTSIDGRHSGGCRADLWAGVDVGKTHHWVCVLDTDGNKLSSVKIANDQSDITG